MTDALTRGSVVVVDIEQAGSVQAPLLAVVIQPAILSSLQTLLIVPLAEADGGAPMLRPNLDPERTLGLGRDIHAMIDLITAVPRSSVRCVLGEIGPRGGTELDRALMLVCGLG